MGCGKQGASADSPSSAENHRFVVDGGACFFRLVHGAVGRRGHPCPSGL